jgi:ribosomal 50S subunit-recycling heat shock protein
VSALTIQGKTSPQGSALRLDLFLKQARLIPRRTLAHEACQRGAILVNGHIAKPAKMIQCGDQIQWRQPSRILTYRVIRIPNFPPGKKEAPSLYELIKTDWPLREF